MNRCMFISTFSEPAECLEQDCAGWDKHAHQCFVHSIPMELQLLAEALDNYSRSINQALLPKPEKGAKVKAPCPLCGTPLTLYEVFRVCPQCNYSDPFK